MHTDSHITDSLYTSYSQIHRAVVQYSSTTTGEIHVIIPAVTGLDTSVPVSFFGREAHPFENDWVVPNVGSSIIVCREDEDYTSVFWINTTYNPVRADVGEANPPNYTFGPEDSVASFDLIDFAGTPTSSGLYLGSVNMGYYSHDDTEWRTYMDYTGKFYLKGSGTNALTWNGSTLAVSGAITASTIDIGTGNTILKVDTAGNLSIGHATPSSAPFQVSNAGAVTASNLTITGGGININSGVFEVTSAGALTATNATITGDITATSGTFTGTVNAGGGTFSGSITASGTISGGNISGAAVSGSTITSSSMTAGTNAWHLDASGNMWWGNFGSYNAAAAGDTTYINSLGAIRATNLAITGGSINIDANFTVTSAGAITAVSGTIGGWSLSSTKIYKNTGADEVRLDASQHIISARGGVAVLRGYDDSEDIRIGIAGDTAYEPSYNQTDDVAMTRESGVIKFSVEQALTVNDGVVTIASPSLTGNPTAPTQSSGNNSTRIATTAYVDAAGGSGTVTSVATTGAITGGTITTTGTIAHSTAAGYKHIPSGGSSGQFLKYSSSGTAVWAAGDGGVTDHGALSGLGDNDHTQYSLTSHNHSGVYATSGHNHSGTYLPLSGGTMSGSLNVGTGTKRIEGGSGGGIMIDSSGSAYLRGGDEANFGVTAYSTGSTYLYHNTNARLVTTNADIQMYANAIPTSDNTYNLGGGVSSNRWKNGYFSNNVYTHDGDVHASDVGQKTDVVDATLGLDFVKGLRPVSYKWIETDDRAGVRTHQGFIAQEVETLLGSDAATTGLWCNTHQPAVPSEEMGDGTTTEAVEESYTQAIRYTELVSVLTKALQELSTKLDAAEARIAVLETT